MKNIKNDKNYYTYGGVTTKDTLSVKEQKELDEKRRNDTLTDEDRKRLLNDDSLSSHRTTSGIFYEDRIKYNPNVEYFMLDYFDKKDARHIRVPYVTQFELLSYLRYFTEESWLDVSGLQIHSERELDTKLEVKCQDGEIRELSLREILFDERYENMSKRVKDDNSDFLKDMYQRRNPPELEEEEYEEEDYEEECV